MALSCKEIIQLIKDDSLPEAFQELDLIIPEDKNLKYKELVNEFLYPNDNFNKITYKQRLIVFVNMAVKVAREVSNPGLDFYDELCRLDFKMQTEHYMSIIPHKPVAAFLIHGDTDAPGNDIRWLSNQLLYRERKDSNNQNRVDDIVTIDCSLWTSVETVLEQLFNKYHVEVGNYIQLRNQLGAKLRDKLSEGHVVCVLKNADVILNDEDKLSALFNDLLVFMEGHIIRNNHKNSLIFLFTNHGRAQFQSGNGERFFWYQPGLPPNQHAIAAVGCGSQRIIDLAPINRLDCTDLTNWITASFGRPDAYEKVKPLTGKEATMIGADTTARPFEVIQNICSGLGIKFEDKWIN
jgi:hypothetical protein